MNDFWLYTCVFYGLMGCLSSLPIALSFESLSPMNSWLSYKTIFQYANIFGKFLLLFVLPIFLISFLFLLLCCIVVALIKFMFYKKEDWKNLSKNWKKLADV